MSVSSRSDDIPPEVLAGMGLFVLPLLPAVLRLLVVVLLLQAVAEWLVL